MSPEGEQQEEDDDSESTPPIAAVPVLVLVLVACVQIVVAHNTALTPWKGGGFGMFSTVDADTRRVVQVYLTVDGREVPVAVPDEFDVQAASLRPMPTERRTERFARRLLEQRWVELREHRPESLEEIEDLAEPAVDAHWVLEGPLHDAQAVRTPQAVRVEVWRPKFTPRDEGGDGVLELDRLQSVTVAADHFEDASEESGEDR